MSRLRSLVASLTALLVLFAASPAIAEDPPATRLVEKDTGTAMLLAIDPIPADALFYAGRDTQARWNLALGALGVGLLVGGITSVDDGSSRNCDASIDCDAIPFIVSGVIAYGAALIWDGIGGVQGVKAHNERVRAAQRAQAIPLASVNTDGTPVFGVHVRF